MDLSRELDNWLLHATDDEDLIAELNSEKNNDAELYEMFYKNLQFGTAGLRGIIGAGSNRMNIYTVRKATQGLANYLLKKFDNPSVAISFDSRIKAQLFASESARVLAANGISVHITKELQPTPVLSYLVRELKCSAGIMITASHNPAEYNGYKCYGPDGCQMTDRAAGEVYTEIERLNIFEDIRICNYDDAVNEKIIKPVSDKIYEKYLNCVLSQAINKDICADADLKVVYTPLNGAGNKLIRKALKKIGIKNVLVVKEQENPDGNFPTCTYPNPERKEALQLGLELCRKENPDLLIASDPDSDRVGLAVSSADGYRLFTGNEIGIMLCEYILSNRTRLGTLPYNPVMVKTIVSSILVEKIAAEYDCELREVLTGFKYIGEQILMLEKDGEEDRFVFGFEESHGYLAGTYVRDKDAVVASMLICEMAAYYKKQGKNLGDVIEDIYCKYGYYRNTTLSFQFEGSAGLEKMKELMLSFRHNTPLRVNGYKVLRLADYLGSFKKNMETNATEIINLPKSDVLSYGLEGGNSVIIRPSGTEPKIKVYITAVGSSLQSAMAITDNITREITAMIKPEE